LRARDHCGSPPPSPEICHLPPKPGEAEVEHLHRAVGPELDVGRFQVAVDDALLVGRLQRFGDLLCDGERLVDRKGTLHNPVSERRAVDELHDERDLPRLP